MNVLNMFKQADKSSLIITITILSQKITFYVNVKYLVDTKSLVMKNLKSIKKTEKDLNEIKIGQCSKYFLMMPSRLLGSIIITKI